MTGVTCFPMVRFNVRLPDYNISIPYEFDPPLPTGLFTMDGVSTPRFRLCRLAIGSCYGVFPLGRDGQSRDERGGGK